MNIEIILKTLNRHRVEYLLIGGMNFLLNHSGPHTYDIDFFVNDTQENRQLLNAALVELSCEWGATEAGWKPVLNDPGWLLRQSVFCLTSPHGAIDIFRAVKGLEDGFDACLSRAPKRSMPDGEVYYSLSDADMLRCQEVLPENFQKRARMEILRRAMNSSVANRPQL